MMNKHIGIYNDHAGVGYRYPHAYAPSPLMGGWPRCGCRCARCCPPVPCCPCICPPCEECPLGPYTVVFDANGGTPIPLPQTVPHGGLVMRPVDPVMPGFVFAGWFVSVGLSVAPWNFDTDMVTGDMTLVAYWTPAVYQVSFDTNGGVPIPAPQMVPYGGLVTRPVDPIREGYVFVAWYSTPDLTGTPWSFGINTVTANMTLYARWLQPA